MVKKPKRNVKRHANKTEDEWRDWGDKFGKRMNKRGKEFGEEMRDLGERLGKKMERRSKKWEKEWKDWWFTTFGFIGPLIGSVFGIICLSVGILALNLINLPLESNFISGVSNFLFKNLHWFFTAFLFFGYTDYFSKRFSETYWIVSPIVTSVGVVIVIWISVWILNLINAYVSSSIITSLSNFLYVNLLGIFFLLLVFGYALVVIKKLVLLFVMGLK